MADSALCLFLGSGQAIACNTFHQAAGPGNVVGVVVEDTGPWIDGHSAPLGSAIEARKDHRLFADAEGEELTLAAERIQLLLRPGVCFRSSLSQQVRGQ